MVGIGAIWGGVGVRIWGSAGRISILAEAFFLLIGSVRETSRHGYR